MNTITLATLLVAASGFAHADVHQLGRGTAQSGAGVPVSSVATIEVQNVQGRASIVGNAPKRSNVSTVASAVTDVQGRS